MKQTLDPSIVRIQTSKGGIVGVGFLVGEQRALTCAHVVASALQIPDNAQEAPANDVLLDFPLVDPGRIITAHVIHWDAARDVAGLELASDLPDDAQPVPLITADDLWGHHFRAFGFPIGHAGGVWASGRLLGREATGWVQIEDVKVPGHRVQPGFSGAPVWDEQLDGVVGMAVAADTDRVTKAAFMIPAGALIATWPELAERSLEAGSQEHLRMQLARLEKAQREAGDPGRFQPQITAWRERIAAWDGRVERQRERIADGLEEQRRRMAEERARWREEKRLRVVGQPPLDVADYFKDRQRDLNKLGQLLSEPATRLVSVIGHGGMGKTALACKVLQDLERHRWPYTDDEPPIDGIAYLSTRTAGISLERLFLDCARLLGGEEQERLSAVWTNPQIDIQEKIPRLLKALSEGRYVILLDNLEDLLDDQGKLTDDDLRLFFEQSMMASQGARLLVTSRVALAFRREVMRFDRQVKLLEGLPTDCGAALLRELDPNGDYGLRDASEERLAKAVELARGVPRALEVLAGILANDPFVNMDEVLETFFEQEDVVQKLIEENYQRLDRDARRVIEALAVLRRPVPPLVVDYLLEPFAPGLDVPSILRRLTRTNVISVDRAAKTVTLHPIDQDYAYSQLPEEGIETKYNRQALERRAADYYVQLRTPEETWKSIDDLEPQLNEFEHRVRAGDYEEACQMFGRVNEYLLLWGHYTRMIEAREKLLGRLASPHLRADTLHSLGRAYYHLGEIERAVELYQRALGIARKMGNRRKEGIWLGHLGRAQRGLGQVEQAIKFYEQALVITRETGNRIEEGRNLGRLGVAYHLLGQIERGIGFLKNALLVARETGDRAEVGRHLGNLGQAYQDLGQVKQAIGYYEEALAVATEIGDHRRQGIQTGRLGDAWSDLGHIEQAISLYEKATAIFQDIGERRWESAKLIGLAKALLAVDKASQSRQHCAKALLLDVPETGYQAATTLGIVCLHQRDVTADEAFTDGVVRCQTMLDKTPNTYRSRYTLATALVGQAVSDSRWANANERPGLLASALTEYRRALEITAAPGVVLNALRDLELIQAAGIEGLEPAFELLENAEYESALPELKE